MAKKKHTCGCGDNSHDDNYDNSHDDDYDLMGPFKKIIKGKKL